ASSMIKFPHFLMVMGPIPEVSWTLDRIDPEGSYVPENLRWANKQVQSQNRTSAVEIEFNGSKYTIRELAQRTGKSYDAVRMGIRRGGEYISSLLQQIIDAG